MSFLRRVGGYTLELRHLEGATAPSHRKEPIEVVQASDQQTTSVPSFAGFMGMAN